MTALTGFIDEINNLGVAKGSHLIINGERYGVYNPVDEGFDTLKPGMEVVLEYTDKGQYKNIKSKTIKPTGNVGEPAPSGAPKTAAKGQGDFPVPALDGRRNITRRDALAPAVSLVNNFCTDTDVAMELEDRIQQVITVAGRFEEFAAGDLDQAQADAAAEALNK